MYQTTWAAYSYLDGQAINTGSWVEGNGKVLRWIMGCFGHERKL